MKAAKLIFGLLFIFALSSTFAQKDNSKENYSKGVELMNAGKYTEAIVFLTKAIDEKADLAPAYYFRAFCYCQLNNPDKACPDLAMASKLGHYVEKVAIPCGCDAKDPQ